MQQTSLEAYWTMPKALISRRQREVLEALRNLHVACNRQVSESAHIPINVVTPRMNELVKKGLVVQDHIDFDITGRRAIFWKSKEN